MDRKPTEEARIQELIRLSNGSRLTLSREILVLKSKLDLPLRIKSSLRGSPTTWLAGSAIAGLATSLLWRKRKPAKSKYGSKSNKLLYLTLTAARPIIKVWLVKRLKHWATDAISLRQNPIAAHKTNPAQSRSYVSPSGS